jgi:hypothetical protein
MERTPEAVASGTINTVSRVSRKFLDNTISDLCWPAFAYIVVAAFVFLTGVTQRDATESIVLLVAMSLMTWLLNTLCKENKTGLSWAVLIAILSGVVVFRYAALLVGVVAVL